MSSSSGTIRSDLRKYGVLRDERGGGGDPESVFSDNIGQFEQRIVVIPVAVNAYDDGRRPVSPELAERRQRGCGNASGIDGIPTTSRSPSSIVTSAPGALRVMSYSVFRPSICAAICLMTFRVV